MGGKGLKQCAACRTLSDHNKKRVCRACKTTWSAEWTDKGGSGLLCGACLKIKNELRCAGELV